MSAWPSRQSALSSSLTSRSQSTRGTGPKRAPASDQNLPAWTSATRVAATEVGRPVDRVVQGHVALAWPGYFRDLPWAKSRWKAEAVGSDWPWYFEPSSAEPYGRSTGELIRKKLIWPIRIP